MKKIIVFLAALWCCAGIALAANVDMNYEGVIDSFTGLPPTVAAEGENNLIRVTSEADYDLKTGNFFIYQSRTENTYLISNILPGMQVRDPVRFSGSLAENCQLLRGGEPVEGADLYEITEPGQYLLAMGDPTTPGTATMAFTIFGATTNQLEFFNPPVGCYIVDAALNDGPTKFSTDYVAMSTDGIYAVTYCVSTTGLNYTLEVGVDHTPPVLALAGVVDGMSSGAVSIADLEEGATVDIVCDGTVLPYSETLKLQGAYRLQVTDAAGNATQYQFTIPIYFNRSSWVFLGLLILCIGGLIAYLWRSKTHLKVR